MTEQTHARVKPLIGLAYILLLLGLVALSVAAYQRSFPWQRTLPVTLTTTQAGLQLNPRSDVKLKGVVVGQVESVASDGRVVTLRLALDPAKTALIPYNVDASIVPKTLFGEKQVNLIPPRAQAGRRIEAGDMIRQSAKSVEFGELYTNLQGVLETLQPAQLSLALNSLAEALRGRGAQLGDTVDLLNTYLRGLNPHLPSLVSDIRKLAATSDIYADAAPDLLRTLDNTSAISAELLVPHERPLADFLRQNVAASDELTDLMHRSGQTLVTLTHQANPVLDVLAKYSPELPCLFDTLVLSNKAFNNVLGGQGPFLSADIDLVVQRSPYKYPKDLPSRPSSSANNDTLPAGIPNWEPHCAAVPSQLRDLPDRGPYELAIQDPVAPAPSDEPGDGGLDGGERPPADSRDGRVGTADQMPDTANLPPLPLMMGEKVNGR